LLRENKRAIDKKFVVSGGEAEKDEKMVFSKKSLK
jgi:hypothetical protein